MLTNSVNMLVFHDNAYNLLPSGNAYCNSPIYLSVNYVYIEEKQYYDYFCDFVQTMDVKMSYGSAVLLSKVWVQGFYLIVF